MNKMENGNFCFTEIKTVLMTVMMTMIESTGYLNDNEFTDNSDCVSVPLIHILFAN